MAQEVMAQKLDVVRKGPLARWGRAALPFIFLAPWIVGASAYYVYPILASLYYSFTAFEVVRAPVWVGLGNYLQLAQDGRFIQALTNSVLYVAVAVPGALVVGMLQALLLNAKIRGQGAFRTLALAPGAVPVAAAAAIWVFLWNPAVGLINSLIRSLGLPVQAWIVDPDLVKWVFVSMAVYAGMGMLIFLAGLQSIPDSLYDAAMIDGATGFRRLLHVTIPLLTPSLLYNLLMGLIGAFQYFSFPMLMTEGGPIGGSTFLGQYLYISAFTYWRMGYASAQAWIQFIICAVAIYFIFRSSARWVYYGGE